MNDRIHLTNAVPSTRNSFSFAPSRRVFLLMAPAIALVWFTVSPAPEAFGVTPAPDGGYPNNNTAEGTDALKSLSSFGTDNTAIGFQALVNNTDGIQNTAIGSQALSGGAGNFNTAVGFQALFSNTTGG